MKKIKLSQNKLINEFRRGELSLIDKIAPSEINFKNPTYIITDNTYISGLIVVNYARKQEIGWIEPIFSLDFDADITIFYERTNSIDVIKELTYNIGSINSSINMVNANQRDIDIIETSYEDAKYIRHEMQVNKEELYRLYIYITVFSKDLSELNFNLHKLEGVCATIGLHTRRGIFRQEQLLKASLPLFINDSDIKAAAVRNVLTNGLISTYPFVSSELCDENGIFIGYNEHNRSLVMIDRFNGAKYKNANMCILGTSGSGKSFFTKLMIIRNRILNIKQFVIDPDREYEKVCDFLDGSFIKIGANSDKYINIFDIEMCENEENKAFLAEKISRLKIFFKFIFKDMSNLDEAILEEKIIKCYAKKGINFDNDSLYKEKTDDKIKIKPQFKGYTDMPRMQDLYEELKSDENLRKMATYLKPFVDGSLSFFNNYTNIDFNNKLVVVDIHDLDEDLLPMGMFMVTEIFWSKIKENKNEKKIIYMDEVWKLIGSTGSSKAAEFVYKIFKTIRKYGGGATAITQDISDFFALEDGKYGRAIVNNSALKFVFQLEEEDVRILKSVLTLSEEEEVLIKGFDRGTGLFYAGKNQVTVKVKAYDSEFEVIHTDRVEEV